METFRKYEEELEINDFPQQARWKVTSKVRFAIKFVIIMLSHISNRVHMFVEKLHTALKSVRNLLFISLLLF